jgi:carbonic anhydrase
VPFIHGKFVECAAAARVSSADGGFAVKSLQHLFENNRAWAARIRERDPDFFHKLSGQQSPSYLWIGCSDSRVPANEIVDLLPGELFVHRNVANLVVHTDLNCLSVLQFAVEILKVRHVIVCGHYGCSGVNAALRQQRLGLSDNWLRHVQDVRQAHRERLANISEEFASARLCELNVIEQVANVCHTSIVRDAWERSQALDVHGWIYGLHDGLLRDLNMTIDRFDAASAAYEAALAAIH